MGNQSFSKSNIVVIVPLTYTEAYRQADGWKNLLINQPVSLKKSSQTTLTLSCTAPDIFTDLTAEYAGKVYTPNDDNEIVITDLIPNKTYSITLKYKHEGYEQQMVKGYTTASVSVNISQRESTNRTITLELYYNLGDAKLSYGGITGNGGKVTKKGNYYTFTDLTPGQSYTFYGYLYVIGSTERFEAINRTFSTRPINITVDATTNSTSCVLVATNDNIDATIDSCGIVGEQKGDSIKLHGLCPHTTYTMTYYLSTKEGGKQLKNVSFQTTDITMQTEQPKVINEGNVIVAAQTNVDDEETNVGFEWRRTDWTNDFTSNTGGAYLYDGMMEGYIRNINANYLWKYRPYYEAATGQRFYGDWVGIDPSNTSYFEPTVHTYDKIQVTGNTAEVKGYAMRGTDNVATQGFKYWKSAADVKATMEARSIAEAEIPADAMIVEAKGQVMTASLTDLDYESTYSYVAFVTTSEGETFYGEQQTFTTGIDTTPVRDLEADSDADATTIARYDVPGHRIARPVRGINILRMSNGSVRKVMVR